MDLYKLKTFKTVAAFLNFNQAAQYLNLAQSTVSNQIKSLEEEIGALLFKRSGKTIQLTTPGEKMVGYANKLLNLEKEAIADITGKKTPTETISVRGPEAVIETYLPALIQVFGERFPKIQFDIGNCLASNIENELQIENVDVAFIFSDYLSSANLITEKILTEELVLVTRPDHPLAYKKVIDTSDLHGENLLFLKTGCGYGLPFKQLLNIHIVKPRSIIEITSVEAIKKCVKKGIGMAILPESSIQNELQNNELVASHWINELQTPILMVWHKDKKIPEPLDHFMRLVRNLGSKSSMIL